MQPSWESPGELVRAWDLRVEPTVFLVGSHRAHSCKLEQKGIYYSIFDFPQSPYGLRDWDFRSGYRNKKGWKATHFSAPKQEYKPPLLRGIQHGCWALSMNLGLRAKQVPRMSAGTASQGSLPRFQTITHQTPFTVIFAFTVLFVEMKPMNKYL